MHLVVARGAEPVGVKACPSRRNATRLYRLWTRQAKLERRFIGKVKEAPHQDSRLIGGGVAWLAGRENTEPQGNVDGLCFLRVQFLFQHSIINVKISLPATRQV